MRDLDEKECGHGDAMACIPFSYTSFKSPAYVIFDPIGCNSCVFSNM